MTPEQRARCSRINWDNAGRWDVEFLRELALAEAKRADEWYDALMAGKGEEAAEVLRRVAVERDAAIRERDEAEEARAAIESLIKREREAATKLVGQAVAMRAVLGQARAIAGRTCSDCEAMFDDVRFRVLDQDDEGAVALKVLCEMAARVDHEASCTEALCKHGDDPVGYNEKGWVAELREKGILP